MARPRRRGRWRCRHGARGRRCRRFSAAAVVAARRSAGAAGSALARHLSASVAAVLGITAAAVTTPWIEPVTDPDQVRVENALSLVQAGLVAMFVAVAIALVVVRLPAVRARWVAAAVTAPVLAAWLMAAGNEPLDAISLMITSVAAVLAVAAAREVPLARLLPVAAACAAALLTAAIPLYLASWAAGSAMTALSANPPVNGADTDLSLAVCGLVLGLVLASIRYLLTRPPREPDGQSQDAGPVMSRA